MIEEYIIEELIKQADNISNAELYDVLEDEKCLFFIFNDYLNKGNEMIRDIDGHFSAFPKRTMIIHDEEEPILVECAILKEQLR